MHPCLFSFCHCCLLSVCLAVLQTGRVLTDVNCRKIYWLVTSIPCKRTSKKVNCPFNLCPTPTLHPSFYLPPFLFTLTESAEVVSNYETHTEFVSFFFYKPHQPAKEVLKHRGIYLYRQISISRDVQQRSGGSSKLPRIHRNWRK